jgi:hypothetical protein
MKTNTSRTYLRRVRNLILAFAALMPLAPLVMADIIAAGLAYNALAMITFGAIGMLLLGVSLTYVLAVVEDDESADDNHWTQSPA